MAEQASELAKREAEEVEKNPLLMAKKTGRNAASFSVFGV
jgi:hypothetical protein